MGCLVDTFIITQSDEFKRICNEEPDIDKMEYIFNKVPERYHKMLKVLMDNFNEELDFIMDRSNFDEVYELIEDLETDDTIFSDRYRGNCLQQVLRKEFFDTLLILENDLDMDKANRFFVVRAGREDIITEEQWKNNIGGDEDFVKKASGIFQKKGYETHSSFKKEINN
tara:strand:+ start:837 stop:1343 length:507 start_codon:yes stop_codon:yes gene_type:complete